MPTNDRLVTVLKEIRKRYDVWGEADVPRLLAALDVAIAALARHQHKLSDSRGECCAGCLCDWPCPDTGAVAAALLGEEPDA